MKVPSVSYSKTNLFKFQYFTKFSFFFHQLIIFEIGELMITRTFLMFQVKILNDIFFQFKFNPFIYLLLYKVFLNKLLVQKKIASNPSGTRIMEADCLDRMNNRAIRVNSRRYRTIRNCFIKLQIYFSYLFALFSISIIVFGLIIFLKSYNNFWLLLPLNGFIFILIGALIYTNGVLKLNENVHSSFKNKSKRYSRYKRSARESHIFESHLSINMLPQCFTSLDVINRPNHNTLTQRYLMLPIDSFNDLNQNQPELNEQAETIVQLNNVDNNDQSWPIDSNNELQSRQRQLNVDEGNITAIANNNSNNNNNNVNENDDLQQRNSIVSSSNEQSQQDDFDLINPNVNEAPPSYEEVIDVTQPINVIYPTL